MSRITAWIAASLLLVVPAAADAQINFQKTGYYVAMGDSVAAGEGAMPVTNGYTYRLYDQGVFGSKQEMDFANIAIRGARSWEFRDHQVPQVLCARTALRPTVITITVGAIDALNGDLDVVGIASRVVDGINRMLNNGTIFSPTPVLDPVTNQPCARLTNVTILVSNYYRIPHPDPAVGGLLDSALGGFDQALRSLLPLVNVPAGSSVKLVDLFNPSFDRPGLVLIGRRFGLTSPLNFEVHPTNLGHAFIAQQFEAAWKNQ